LVGVKPWETLGSKYTTPLPLEADGVGSLEAELRTRCGFEI